MAISQNANDSFLTWENMAKVSAALYIYSFS